MSKKIQKKQKRNKSVVIIGAGYIANEYANVLYNLKIKDVTIIGKSKENVEKICKKFNYNPIIGGYKNNFKNIGMKDLVIVATPIDLLIDATKTALKNNQNNILVEKPGDLNSKKLSMLKKEISNQRIRIAYNRLTYPTISKLNELIKKDGGVTSCKFSFTEWTDKINFEKSKKQIYEYWGIANSLHVISTVFHIIGLPKKMSPYRFGKLKWHKSGSIFVGSGISEKNIPFSYHGDWGSAGRWGIEIMTKDNAYRLSPLEELEVCKKNSIVWTKIKIKNEFPGTKLGLVEQILIMLDKSQEKTLKMIKLDDAIKFNKIAEEIFGYNFS